MAFSFRAGTNWCHDFPKLARDSGFCFNVRRTRVRVDWNRISSIDVERVIRERDFFTVDDNVNNVVDYSLESEYDVKILDPNFVKLFRLAQLSVEYLLYCKQYLDHSVIILKDELRLKIENNAAMKKEIKALEETIKDLNLRVKEQNRIIESKLGDYNGELFKCPQCMKTFITAKFMSAHVARRHGHLGDTYMTAPSPVHEQYRVETEKLHDEIKTLKERLNQTERVIRNEPDKGSDCGRADKSYKPNTYEKGEYTSALEKDPEERLKEQQLRYQDEIASLKNMLFTEIRNLKQRERSASPLYHAENDSHIMDLKELIKKQDNEIYSLRDQLRKKLSPDLKHVQEKLQDQEQHWKVINERLEKQHIFDTENLTMQLKMSQEAAREMKELYESKINELEMHSKSQTKTLEAQGMHLKQLSRDLWESREISQANIKEPIINLQDKLSSRNMINKVQSSIRDAKNDYRINYKNNKHDDLVCEEMGSASSNESPKILASPKFNTKSFLQNEDHNSLLSGNGDFETSEDTESVTNNKQVTPVVNSRKLKMEKKQDLRNENRNLVEKLNLRSLESDRREKLFNESAQKSADNQTHRNRKHQSIINGTKSETLRPSIESRNSNESSKRSEQVMNLYKSKQNDQISDDKLIKSDTLKKSIKEPEDSEEYSETESESDTSESESKSLSENEETETIKPNPLQENFKPRDNFKELIKDDSDLLQELNAHLRAEFDNKLRDLGIDPEWNGIPNATFKQKMETVAHHQKINSKKINGYNRIRLKILKEISHTSLKNRTEPKSTEKISPLDRIMSKVKTKTANVLKSQQKNFEPRTPTLKSQPMTPRDKVTRPTSNLEILPKKMKESDIHGRRSIRSTESLQKREPESRPKVIPISVRNTENLNHTKQRAFNRKPSNDVADESRNSTSLERLQQFQNDVEYFSESNSLSKGGKFTLQAKSTKVTSTPKKSVQNVMERSYSSVEEDSDIESTNLERARSLPVSPKNNKSVLKSTTGSVGSLVKKKVLFDLEQSLEKNGKSPNKHAPEIQISRKLFPEYEFEDEKINEDDWNISNFSDDAANLGKGKTPSADNISLKTSQSDKIAKISKKIQDQLNTARQKPVGAIEAMFLAKPASKINEKENMHYRSSTSIASSILESPKNQYSTKKPSETPSKAPKPAPRTPRKHESDLESDIEELLQMG